MTFHCLTMFTKEKKVGHGTRLEPKVEISSWVLSKHTFNTHTFKVGPNTK